MSYIDLSTATKTDPSSNYSFPTDNQHVTVTTMARTVSARLSLDYGAAHFINAWRLRYTVDITALSANNASAIGAMLASAINTTDDLLGNWVTPAADAVFIEHNNPTDTTHHNVNAHIIQSGVASAGTAISLPFATTYYVEGYIGTGGTYGTFFVNVYSDAAFSTSLGSTSVALTKAPSFQFFLPTTSRHVASVAGTYSGVFGNYSFDTSSGAGAGTLDNFTGSGTADSGSTAGSGAGTLDDFTGSGTGTVPSVGTGAGTLDDFTGSGTGTVPNVASGSGTLDDFTGSGTADSGAVAGSGSGTLDDFTGAGTGSLTNIGAGAGTLDDFTGSGTGTVPVDVYERWSITVLSLTARQPVTGLGNAAVTFEAEQENTGLWFSWSAEDLEATRPTRLALLEDTGGNHNGKYISTATPAAAKITGFNDWMLLTWWCDYGDGNGPVVISTGRVRYNNGVELLPGLTAAQAFQLAEKPILSQIVGALPDVTAIRSEMDTNSTKLALVEVLPAAVLAAAAVTPIAANVEVLDAAVTAQIAAQVAADVDALPSVQRIDTNTTALRQRFFNDYVLDKNTGILTILNDAGNAALFVCHGYSDTATATPYDGWAAIHHTTKWETPP